MHLNLGAVALGTANLGNFDTAMTDALSWQIMEQAWEEGIRYFDTAPHYGLGLSERRVGDFLRTKPRDEYIVSTKVGRLLRPHNGTVPAAEGPFAQYESLSRVWDFSAEGIRRSLEESLIRLGLDRVDLLYLHDPQEFDREKALTEALPALAGLRSEGVISAMGVGSMNTQALGEAAASGTIDYLMLAGRFTLAEQPAYPHIFDECVRNGVTIVNASIFNSGLLSTNDPAANSLYDYAQTPPALLAHVLAIRDACAEFGVDLPAAALHFAAKPAAVGTVVISGNDAEQVRQNIARSKVVVPTELWAALAQRGLIPAELA